MRIRLSDEDRERLGLQQEWVSFSADRLMMSEAEDLEQAGYDPDDYLEDCVGYPVTGPDGQVVMVGEGDSQVPKRTFPVRRIKATVWLALRRAGVKVPYTDLDFDTRSIGYAPDEEPEPAGKGEAPASAKPASGTPSRSRKSSGSARGRSNS